VYGVGMKYEKKLKELQQNESKDWFKPLQRTLPTTTPRGQKIERRSIKTLTSNVKRQFWNEES
jgi:hypothetical protein